jgi:hypothetical protein
MLPLRRRRKTIKIDTPRRKVSLFIPASAMPGMTPVDPLFVAALGLMCRLRHPTRLALCNRAYSDPSHPFMRGPYHTGLGGFRPIRAHTIGAIVCSEAAPTRSRAQRRKNHNSADTTTEITMHVTIGK